MQVNHYQQDDTVLGLSCFWQADVNEDGMQDKVKYIEFRSFGQGDIKETEKKSLNWECWKMWTFEGDTIIPLFPPVNKAL